MKHDTSLIEKSIDPEMTLLVYEWVLIHLSRKSSILTRDYGNSLPYGVATHKEGLWGLTIGSFLNGEKSH